MSLHSGCRSQCHGCMIVVVMCCHASIFRWISFVEKSMTGDFDGFWMDFGWILDGFWMDFGWILDGFWMDFGWILDGFWMDFGWIFTSPARTMARLKKFLSLAGGPKLELRRIELSSEAGGFPGDKKPGKTMGESGIFFGNWRITFSGTLFFDIFLYYV